MLTRIREFVRERLCRLFGCNQPPPPDDKVVVEFTIGPVRVD